MMEKRKRRSVHILMWAVICLVCGCGQAQSGVRDETGMQTDAETESESEISSFQENLRERNHTDETEGEILTNDMPSYFPAGESLKTAIYRYYDREEEEKISEEEVRAAKGKLAIDAPVIHNGAEFALMREWYDWETLSPYERASVFFSEDLADWQEEELEALKILKCNVYVESSGETVPARALSYLTGATNLDFSEDSDMTDVSGTMPAGRRFPQQIKCVWLNTYREEKYRALLQLLQDSQVEEIRVRVDEEAAEPQGFWLDDAAGLPALKAVYLSEAAIRLRDQKALAGCKVERITGRVDQKTDVTFVMHLPALEELECDVMEDCALQSLLERTGYSLVLRFQADCPAFYQRVAWPESEEDCTPFCYQRKYDEERMAECFIGKRETETDLGGIDIGSGNPLIRVKDGAAVYEIRPGEDETRMYDGIQMIYMQAAQMLFADLDFDGTKDLLMPAVRNGVHGPVRTGFAYLWNRTAGRYEFCPSYRWIDDPDVDGEQRLIRSTRYLWDSQMESGREQWLIYRYVDGEFEEQGSLTEEIYYCYDEISEEILTEFQSKIEVPEGALLCRWQEEIMEKGETAAVKTYYAAKAEGEEGVYPKACEAYYAADSYWGSPDYHGNW